VKAAREWLRNLRECRELPLRETVRAKGKQEKFVSRWHRQGPVIMRRNGMDLHQNTCVPVVRVRWHEPTLPFIVVSTIALGNRLC
jgi:hypothetical protein